MEGSMVDGLSAAIRALSFIALFQAAGIATFVAIFGRQLTVTLRGTQSIGVTSAGLAILFTAAHYGLEAARMAGEFAGVMDAGLQSLVFHSPTVAADSTRIIGLMLIAVGLSPAGKASNNALSVLGVALCVFSFALVGHTSDDPQRVLLATLLAVHLLVVAFWFGALVPLYRASAKESLTVAGEVTEAYSRLAVWIVPALLVAGAVLAALLLPSWAALLTTYGQLLLLKIGAFAVLMILGALNKWRFGPALARGDLRAARHLRGTLAFEYVLIAGTLTVTAVLTSFFSPH